MADSDGDPMTAASAALHDHRTSSADDSGTSSELVRE